MHWSEKIAQEIIARNPNKAQYVCAAGISPSGSVHIGNFRDIATSYFVVKALKKAGKNAKLLFSWDEFDRLRKVPVNVAEIAPDFQKYIGKPYAEVPDPYGCCASYAEHFEKEFERSLARFGIEVDFRRQCKEYRSGRYTKHILTALEKRGEIFDILDSFRTQDAAEGERDNYYPVSIYCPVCGKDTTTITAMDDEYRAQFTCKCGHEGTFDFKKDTNCKLAWKIDWPMRWMEESVDFEPGGKDHASPTGSYQTSRIIAKQIYGYDAPMFQGYEFIGIKGLTGKMSGSSGLNLTPEVLLKLYQPEVILWLYSKTEPNKAFDFCFDDEILRQYFEFDKSLNEYRAGTDNEYLAGIMYNCVIDGRTPETVPMSQLVQLGSVVDFNPDMLERVFEKIGTPYTKAQFSERLALAEFWLDQCAPQNRNTLLASRNFDVWNALDDSEKKAVCDLHDYLAKGGYTLDELQTELYAIPKRIYQNLNDKELKALQGKFFKNVYQLLIGKEKGPRLYLFLYAIEVERYLGLLDFSTPQTEEEKPVAEVVAPQTEGENEVEPDEIPAVRDEILLDDFEKIDMRVCKVLACEEVKKSRSLLKLTLDDGMDGRVIVSSIKGEYQPEELVGKKIIVICNLKPVKLSGVVSCGMLLAGSNNSCGVKVVFVDDSIPQGTRIG